MHRCTHPIVRKHMDHNPSMSCKGRDGTLQAKDRRIEYMHAEAAKYNVDPKHAVEDILFFTEFFEPMDHINTKYNEMLGIDNSTPMEAKKGFRDTVAAMVQWLEARIAQHKTQQSVNPFTGLSIETGDYRVKQPWMFTDKIAEGGVGPMGYPTSKRRWQEVAAHVMNKPMFQVGPPSNDEYEAGDEDWGFMDDNVLDFTPVVVELASL